MSNAERTEARQWLHPGFNPDRCPRCASRLSAPFHRPPWRMRGDRGLIDVGPPTDAGRQQQFTVLDFWNMRDEVVLPRHILDIDLHHAEVGDGGAEMRAHQRAEMTVEVVRRNVDLIGVAHRGDLVRLEYAIPGDVDDGDVDRLVFQVRTELPPPVQRFQRGDRSARRPPDRRQRLRVIAVHLQPHEFEFLQRLGKPHIAFGLEVEVQIQMQADTWAGATAERGELGAQRVDERFVDVALRPAGTIEARHVDGRRIRIEPHDVRLEAFEATFRDLGSGAFHVGERTDRVISCPLLDRIGEADAPGAAMRPIQPQPLADRAAEKFVHRNVQCFGFDVDQRVLDRGNGLLVDAVRGLTGQAVQESGDFLHGPRVHANQALAQSGDDSGEALGAEIFHEFGPADQAVRGGDLQKREVTPAGVAVQWLDFSDAHERFLPDQFRDGGCWLQDRDTRGARQARAMTEAALPLRASLAHHNGTQYKTN